jgi:LPS sulfotransferase NodH
LKIPEDAIIPNEKITRYLLVQKPRNDKSKFLAGAGFTQDNPEALKLAIETLLQIKLWKLGSTPNNVFGFKYGMSEPHFSSLLETFRQFPGCNGRPCDRGEVWENAFPNGKHIFMTRRNKVRLAVSWWKAIQTQEWHRKYGAKPTNKDVSDRYSFDAIDKLYAESVMREAGMQEFFTEAHIVPLTVVYEDFVRRYEITVFEILAYFGISSEGVTVTSSYYEQLADDISEEWAQRFRQEKQDRWEHIGW